MVEDEPAVRQLVVRALAGEGYQVVEAADGDEAKARLAGLQPALLIVDIMIPKLDGLRLVQQVRGQPETRHVPVIFLTGRSDPQTMADGLDAGARYYVTKPFGIDDLLGKVSRALGHVDVGGDEQ